eukprot:NODE_1575_length_1486_cov_29.578984_g1421_i0.p1 GENE.NODE_1575_length_1486_cov_29.578984_g1421_i0~~NODE_1575_length_1486_cov_29.578984_g1421_i0.p1  ORF type:complete len:460 (-),score=91.63 NODE_1575_length_1486_cov_29.578984_g1421_i0:107-1411(-)
MSDSDAFLDGWDSVDTVRERIGSALLQRGIDPDMLTSSAVQPFSSHSGLSAAMQILLLCSEDAGTSQTSAFVIKRTRDGAAAQSKSLGLYREVSFYKLIAPRLEALLDSSCSAQSRLRKFLPDVLYCEANPLTGNKLLVMARIDGVECGLFFPHTVHNAHKLADLPSLTAGFADVTEREIALKAACLAGALHGRFWKDEALLDAVQYPHLRGAEWFRGEGRESFLASNGAVATRWKTVVEQLDGNNSFRGVQLDSLFIAVMNASIAQAEEFDHYVEQRRGESSLWSLVHGDFHSGNFMVTKSAADGLQDDFELILLDWEVVGVGSGPQDIGQFLISHVEPSVAAQLFPEVAQAYHNAIVETIPVHCPAVQELPSLDSVIQEVVAGGMERWVWLNGYMMGMDNIPTHFLQYFHDQTLGWIRSHGITPETVGMPRP